MASDRYSGNARRFRPELVESSSRSSRVHNARDVETFPTSSHFSSSPHTDCHASHTSQSPSHHEDKNKSASITTEKPRRFLPQPTETSSRSSRRNAVTSTDDQSSNDLSRHSLSLVRGSEEPDSKRSTCLLPQPFEVKQSNRKAQSQNTNNSSESEKEGKKGSNALKIPRKFRPEPIETVKSSRRKPVNVESRSSTSSSQSTPRKFTPQLIETGKRSFRRAETAPTERDFRSFDDASVADDLSRPSSPPVSRGQQIVAAGEANSFPTESQFSYASLLQRQEGRRHSFRVPDLPAIPSSNSSEGSEHFDMPSLSTTPSASSEESANRLAEKNRFRESCDERFSGYLMSLAARSAEKQLRDQALAAFPNEQEHQPVSHFAIDGDEEFGNDDIESVVTIPRSMNRGDARFRRESITDLAWELEEMRRHKEVAERKDLGVQKSDAHESRFSAAAIAARQLERKEDGASLFAGWRRDLGLAQMRHAASPPMLGDDIVFTLSASPQGTASETDQMISVSQMEPEPIKHKDQSGLWTADVDVEGERKPGLWMGMCHKEEGDDEQMSQFHKARTGIATPRTNIGAFDGSYFDLKHLDEDKMETDSDTEILDTPAGIKPFKNSMVAASDEQNVIDEEFNDGFVTQVYNYLSLGYPSLARYFDAELSKISGIPVADLRQDDLRSEAKGYVLGVPSDTAGSVSKNTDVTSPEKCMRWKALRLYINEWARQRPEIDLNNDESLDAWGVIERRGSWAV